MKIVLTKNTSNFLKVISAVMVMLHHYSQYICVNHISDSLFYKILSSQGGFLGVAVFFFLSGYGLMESEHKSHLSIGEFLKRRILKVYFPVLLITCLWMFVSPFILATSPFTGLEVSMSGKILTISNVLIEFGDGVLWFIPVLVVLYCMFYIFCTILQSNRTGALIFLCVCTIVISVLRGCFWASSSAISIPFFTTGIVLSLFKEQKRGVLISIISLVIISILYFVMLNRTLAIHAVLNVVSLLFLILLFSCRHVDIKIPAVLGIISFDLYLVHNKVLMALRNNMDIVPISVFIITTLVMTVLFYLFRSNILKI